jgi:hypothetical protein
MNPSWHANLRVGLRMLKGVRMCNVLLQLFLSLLTGKGENFPEIKTQKDFAKVVSKLEVQGNTT